MAQINLIGLDFRGLVFQLSFSPIGIFSFFICLIGILLFERKFSNSQGTNYHITHRETKSSEKQGVIRGRR